MLTAAVARSLRPFVDRHLPRAAMAWRHYRDLRQLSRRAVETPFGFRLVGNPAMETGRFEPDETALVRAELRRSDVFVDVGANIGYYCLFALQAGRPVVAFEPAPNNLRYLFRNLRENGWTDGIEVHAVALGEASGVAELYGGGTAASLVPGWAAIPTSYRQTVPLSTLDRHLDGQHAGQRLFVLVDVEGAELAMLRGAETTLARRPMPVWLVEIAIDEHQPGGAPLNPHLEATFAIFERHGYAAWQVGPAIEPLPYSRIRRIARSGRNSLRTHSFLFAEHGHFAPAEAAPGRAAAR